MHDPTAMEIRRPGTERSLASEAYPSQIRFLPECIHKIMRFSEWMEKRNASEGILGMAKNLLGMKEREPGVPYDGDPLTIHSLYKDRGTRLLASSTEGSLRINKDGSHGGSRRNNMPFRIVLCLVLFVAVPVVSFAQAPDVVAVSHTYEARIRLNGKVSTTRVQASDAGQAKKLVQSQFPNATGLTLHQRFGFPNTTHQKVS